MPFRFSGIACVFAIGFSSALVAACSDDGAAGSASAGVSPRNTRTVTLTCSANVSPGTLMYRVNGTTLTLSSPSSSGEVTLTRKSSGSRPVEGDWHVDASPKGDLEMARKYNLQIDATMRIGAASVTMLNTCTSNFGSKVAQASSAAKIDDTTIEVLGREEDKETITGIEAASANGQITFALEASRVGATTSAAAHVFDAFAAVESDSVVR